MAKDDNAIHEAHEIGIIDKLQSIAEQYCDSPSIQNRMLDVVSTYFTSDDDRKRIIESALIEIIIDLLVSNDRPVRQSACMAIMIIARSEQSATALVSKGRVLIILTSYEFYNRKLDKTLKGVLDALCKVNQSNHLRSKLADCTLQEVLNCNLSAKYALRRKLNQTDKIKGKLKGFFYVGKNIFRRILR